MTPDESNRRLVDLNRSIATGELDYSPWQRIVFGSWLGLAAIPIRSPWSPKARVLFDLFAQAGGNSLRAAKLLQQIHLWCDPADPC